MTRGWMSGGLLAICVTALAGVTSAQFGRLPIEPERESYRVRLVNEMGYPIRVKMVRYGMGRFLEEDLPRGGGITRRLYAGERVLCVWDRNEQLTLAAQVNVNRSGTLRLRRIPQVFGPGAPRAFGENRPRTFGGEPARRDDGRRDREQQGPTAEPLPRLQIED